MNNRPACFVSLGELLTKENTMKRIAIALLASAAALAANSARADTRVSVGVNVGTPVYRAPAPAVVYAPPPAVVYAPVAAPVRGYWKDVVVKTWVPERWISSRDRWGRHVRVSEPGYYTYRTDRVWVDGHSDRGNHYGHESRGYSYGYDGSRDHDNRGGWNR
jgi:hypothetical protein